MKKRTIGLVLLAWLPWLGCDSGGGGPAGDADAARDGADSGGDALDVVDAADADQPEPPPTSGRFTMMTYNIAGLPEGISSSHPEAYIPLLAPKLGAYDLVVVQEDFWYHDLLVAGAPFEYISAPMFDDPLMYDMGDGLNRLSHMPFGEVTRFAWEGCNGELECASDCLATKGFSMATSELAPGVEVDVYNLHAEAGGCPEDLVLRASDMDELASEIVARSAGRPVLVGGDFNLHLDREPDAEAFQHLLDTAGLTFSCEALDCGVLTIDKILFRSSAELELTPTDWRQPDEFFTEDGEMLSDHTPTAVDFEWRLLGEE